MAPVFSLVLDKDVNEDLALLYPELYKELTKVSLSTSSLKYEADMPGSCSQLSDFLHLAHHLGISRYASEHPLINETSCPYHAGGIIMLLSLLLFESEFLHIVAISYTALVINELIMVALEITTWHTYMVLSELGTAVVYFGSMAILPAYFGE